MNILIRGMEMPERCEECPCFYPEYNECNAIVGRWVDGKGTPPFDCPLVPVPPHGRLVDLDKIENEIARLSPEGYTTGGIRQVLDCAPTVIPAEEDE